VKSINLVLLGQEEDYTTIIKQMGAKKGTSTDISIYDRKIDDVIYTYAIPNTFPDKIQPLIQAINLGQYAILSVTNVDKYLGEQIIALDSLNFTDGFILHSYEVDEEKLRALVRNTSVSCFKLLDSIEQLKQEITRLEPKGHDDHDDSHGRDGLPVMVPIDHVFDVKGVGTVVLGIIRQGTVKVYDQLKIMPSGKDVVIKSIQIHDAPVDISTSSARVGLAIKGISVDEISRGDVICSSGYMEVSTSANPIHAKFVKNSYYKGDLADNQIYLFACGLQVKPVKVKKTLSEEIEIIPDKPIVFLPNTTYILLKPANQGTRIIGKGILLDK